MNRNCIIDVPDPFSRSSTKEKIVVWLCGLSILVDFKNARRSRVDFKNLRRSRATKILMVRSLSYLENGPPQNMEITGWFYVPFLNPQLTSTSSSIYISTSSSNSQVCNPPQVSNYFNDLQAGLLVDFNNLIILKRSKHTMHAIF